MLHIRTVAPVTVDQPRVQPPVAAFPPGRAACQETAHVQVRHAGTHRDRLPRRRLRLPTGAKPAAR